MVDQLASTVSLARGLRDGLDPNALNTTVQTQSLLLILSTFIELYVSTNPTAQTVRQAQVGFVRSRLTGVEGF